MVNSTLSGHHCNSSGCSICGIGRGLITPIIYDGGEGIDREPHQEAFDTALKEYGVEPGQETIPGPVESVTYTTGFPGDPVRQIGEK